MPCRISGLGIPVASNTARAVLLTAQDLSRRGDPAAARTLLLDFDKAAPSAPLRAERLLAVATTWEQENKWAEAISQYDDLLAGVTNYEVRPRAEYYRALDTSQAGRDTNALTLFTNFVAQFPTNKFARLAQMWVARYYYNIGNYVEAERNYQVLFQNTNWPPDELTYQAQLMAGQTAVARQGWKDATTYFTQLANNTSGNTNPPILDLHYHALFEYALTLIRVADPADTNRLANLEQATITLGRICDDYATNKLAIRAWGERANCYLQWALARQQYDSLTNAINAYQRVLDSPQADVVLRSQAKVGLAVTLAKWAEQKTGKERTALLEQALNHCLDVVYGKILRDDERLDPFWTKEAGVKAFDLAESLQAWSQEVRLYERLTNSIWPRAASPAGEARRQGAGEPASAKRQPAELTDRHARATLHRRRLLTLRPGQLNNARAEKRRSVRCGTASLSQAPKPKSLAIKGNIRLSVQWGNRHPPVAP